MGMFRLSQPAQIFSSHLLRNLIWLLSVLLLAACQVSTMNPAEQTSVTTARTGYPPAIETSATPKVEQKPVEPQSLIKEVPPPVDLWQRISAGFEINTGPNNSRIDAQISWYAGNQPYFDRVSSRATPFLYWIVEQIELRQLPLELALVPIVESAYDPAAYSSEHAVGLWQFMGSTADSFGVQRDWWYDGRRDPLISTVAALDYLQYLHQQFDNNWLLALAAYNAGEGSVRRAIRRNLRDGKSIDFWSLNLPLETREHVARIFAIATVVSSPATFDVELPAIPNQPHLEVVDLEFQIDLERAAQAAGIGIQELKHYNPGYLRWATHPDGPYHLAVPIQKTALLRTNIASIPADQRVTWDQYQIQSGDTLIAIARKFDSQVATLQKINNLKGSRIVAGRTLLIPRTGNVDFSRLPTIASVNEQPIVPERYRVRSGDNLWAIARKYNLHSTDIARWNNIDLNTLLHPGQILVLHTLGTAHNNSSFTDESTSTYTIVHGDSLARIASKFNVTVDQLAAWNNINKNSTIYPGQKLALGPGAAILN